MKLSCIITSTVLSVALASVAVIFMWRPLTQATITHRVFTVAATNDEWTQTDITVAPGDILITNETGNKITVDKSNDAVGANGLGDIASALYILKAGRVDSLEEDIGALYMKIGIGAGTRIGAHGNVQASESGVVKLRVHDTKYSDNAGNFTVDIIHIPGSLIPPPQAVKQ